MKNPSLPGFPYRIILGSASPRRQELMKGLGYDFTVKKISADESQWSENLTGKEIPLYLAGLKADSYAEKIMADEILITADTVVWCDDKIFNKPADFEDGKRMLKELSGKMHQVFTAVCLKSASKKILFHDESRVYFKEFTEAEITYYLDNYRPYDKAGAYGVQEWLGYIGIERIEGSFYNVMGLPVKRVYEELQKF